MDKYLTIILLLPIDYDSLKTLVPEKNIWNKVKKSSKIGLDQKSLISTFALFLVAMNKVFFLPVRLATKLCLHPILRYS